MPQVVSRTSSQCSLNYIIGMGIAFAGMKRSRSSTALASNIELSPTSSVSQRRKSHSNILHTQRAWRACMRGSGKMTELSIIIPYYNRPASVVSYCFESIRRAAVDLNVQILLVDDGSKPPARSTLDGMLDSVTVVETENRGLLFARLAGLDRATGE